MERWGGPWLLCLLPLMAVGQPLDAGSAAYEERTVTGIRGRAVELSCGSAAPAVVFWSFTAAGSAGPPRAVAVGSGPEAAVAPGAGALGRVTLRNGTLELRELRTAAAGRFLCQGLFPEWGRLRVGYAAVMLRVLVPVSKPFVRLTAAAAAEGTEVALTCTVREGTAPLSFSWQHREPHGGLLAAPTGLGGSGAELLLAPANRSHAGWYACTARNEVNNRTSEPVYLDIVYGPDEPAISVEPFSLEQGSFSAGEREDVVLSCLAPSNPPSRYIWLHNGSQVHIGQTFVMSAIARGQAGTYTCLAENTHLQTRTQATIVLTVYYVPELEVERGEVAVLEGGEARLACRQRGGGELGAEMGWYDPQEREVPAGTTKYRLERGGPWANLTVRDAEWPQDGGTYRCAAANSVGTASLPVRLRVDRYPAPPNVTISKLRYTRARTEVRLQWRTEGAGNLTGFVVQRRPAKKPQRRVPGPWETAAGDIEPHSRDRRLGGLDPRVVYAFRVLAVNHRTAGHPSEVQTPAEPPFEALPAVTGAAVMGMLVATSMSLLAVHCIARHRDRLPRLHELLFRIAGPDAPQLAEDANVAMSTEDGEGQGQEEPGGPSTAAMEEEPRSAPPGDPADDAPVDVTITMTAMP
eukprot:XP_015153587.1 V-set and immunoglobulin domain-containing protein 10-like 2 isoform X3 [Gallus gallus]